MKYFSYKGGRGIQYMKLHVLRCINEELAWAINNWLWFISNKMLFKTVTHATKKLSLTCLPLVVHMQIQPSTKVISCYVYFKAEIIEVGAMCPYIISV